ncbi:ADP-ribosyl-[dinitrogen reductase] hydrolase [bacterium]|nr:MAG: ADP-ribosyl-[dinitrogen reductase] hydrolase [bacterium]
MCALKCTDSPVAYPAARDKARGALLGLAVGDALGATVEFMSPDEIRSRYGIHDKMTGGGWLYLRPGQVTDDTEMSIAIARAIVDRGTFDIAAVAESLANWLIGKPVDVGSTCSQGISRYLIKRTLEAPKSDWHAGNGAAMRMGPVALASFCAPENLGRWSLEQARFTHNHPLSDDACLMIGQLVHAALAGQGKVGMYKIARSYPEFAFEPFNGKAGGYIVETMAAVLSSFFDTDTFEDCIVTTVNLGQDADTTGAIAGLIAGAHYDVNSIPRRWLGKLDPKIREELSLLAEKLLALGLSSSKIFQVLD